MLNWLMKIGKGILEKKFMKNSRVTVGRLMHSFAKAQMLMRICTQKDLENF